MKYDIDKIKAAMVAFPFVDKITHIFIGSQETADSLGFPKGGHWYKEGNLWELRQSLNDETYQYDDSKCSTCQNWGYPTGCKECGLTAMGG